jgi:hypothetical protein
MSDSKNYKLLLGDIKNKPFVLFLGAGLNANLAPFWNSLLRELLRISLKKLPENLNDEDLLEILKKLEITDVYFKASIIKNLLGNEYYLYMQKAIYKKIVEDKFDMRENYKEWQKPQHQNFTEPEFPHFLYLVAKLCCNPKIHAVVTYNYDDFLNSGMNIIHARKAIDVFQNKIDVQAKDDKTLLIYHVHGLIPSPEKIKKESFENIVFSYDEYFHNFLEFNSWQTTVQLHFLMNYTCVFLGTSLIDWNMLRMLTTANKYAGSNRHYAFFCEQENLNMVFSKLKSTIFSEAGVRQIIAGKSYHHIYQLINDLTNKI